MQDLQLEHIVVPTGQSQGGSAPSLFGGFSTPAFGASAASTPAFGAASSSAFSFGGASTPAFGAGSAPAFGGASASAPSIFGSTPGFGAANSSAFSFAGQSRHPASLICHPSAYNQSSQTGVRSNLVVINLPLINQGV